MIKTSIGIGVMSGTSLDGVDVVLVKFNWHANRMKDSLTYDFLKTQTFEFNSELRYRLQKAYDSNAEEVAQLDADLGFFYGELINEFIKSIKSVGFNHEIDFVASHGQTIFHRPEKKMTMQIGNGPHISLLTGIRSVTNFRVEDVVLGGQGAPLVPIGDVLLFGNYESCLNLGGFSNISYDKDGQRIAYDVSPSNILLNEIVSQRGYSFDDKGVFARSGSVNRELLEELNRLEFYDLVGPKSLGIEQINQFYKPLLWKYDLEFEDALSTLIEHQSIQIARSINQVGGNCLVTGGGTKNTYFIERISAHLNEESILVVPDEDLINFKEALIFALLGLLKIEGKNNVLASVTGASRDHSAGVVYNL